MWARKPTVSTVSMIAHLFTTFVEISSTNIYKHATIYS